MQSVHMLLASACEPWLPTDPGWPRLAMMPCAHTAGGMLVATCVLRKVHRRPACLLVRSPAPRCTECLPGGTSARWSGAVRRSHLQAHVVPCAGPAMAGVLAMGMAALALACAAAVCWSTPAGRSTALRALTPALACGVCWALAVSDSPLVAIGLLLAEALLAVSASTLSGELLLAASRACGKWWRCWHAAPRMAHARSHCSRAPCFLAGVCLPLPATLPHRTLPCHQ